MARSINWMEEAADEIAGDPHCCDISSSSPLKMEEIIRKHCPWKQDVMYQEVTPSRNPRVRFIRAIVEMIIDAALVIGVWQLYDWKLAVGSFLLISRINAWIARLKGEL